MNEYEIEAQRTLTDYFISMDPDSVVLQPFTRESNGSGGYVRTPGEPRSAQDMRMIPLTEVTSERHTLDGKVVTPEWMLMGRYDAVVERGDQFELNGDLYEVVHVQEKKDYQTKAETVYLGSA